MTTSIFHRHPSPCPTSFPDRRPRRRRPTPRAAQSCPRNRRDRSTVSNSSPKTLISGQVKILKRGEPLTPFICKTEDPDLTLGSTERLGPDPETVRKEISVPGSSSRAYAGSGIHVESPPPSSVPLPGFLYKIGTTTRDFQLLLRLDLA